MCQTVAGAGERHSRESDTEGERDTLLDHVVRETTLKQKQRESGGLSSTEIRGEGTLGGGKSRAVLAGMGTPCRRQRHGATAPGLQ